MWFSRYSAGHLSPEHEHYCLFLHQIFLYKFMKLLVFRRKRYKLAYHMQVDSNISMHQPLDQWNYCNALSGPTAKSRKVPNNEDVSLDIYS